MTEQDQRLLSALEAWEYAETAADLRRGMARLRDCFRATAGDDWNDATYIAKAYRRARTLTAARHEGELNSLRHSIKLRERDHDQTKAQLASAEAVIEANLADGASRHEAEVEGIREQRNAALDQNLDLSAEVEALRLKIAAYQASFDLEDAMDESSEFEDADMGDR